MSGWSDDGGGFVSVLPQDVEAIEFDDESDPITLETEESLALAEQADGDRYLSQWTADAGCE